MAFGQDFLKTFFGNDYVKDYTHASKIFRSNGYLNSPRFKFLFHVYFNLNSSEIPALRNVFPDQEASTIGLLVKNIELPSYKFDVETLNQYNRKRLVQKKIEYQPVTVRFHDDQGDLIRNMWYNYFAYYYKDPNQKWSGIANTNGTNGNSATLSNGFDYNTRDIYSPSRLVNDWGFIGESYSDGTNSPGGKPAFFRDISIYGLDQHRFVQYVLINPIITDWNHDTYDYSQGGEGMENTMTIQYETVKYYSGAIGGARSDNNVKGFASPANYDQQQSPLSRPGGTRSVLGQGGLLDAGAGIISDLQSGSVAGVIGAVQKAGTTYNTFKGADLKSVVKEEGLGVVQTALRNTTQGTPGGFDLSSVQNAVQRPIFPTPARDISGAVTPFNPDTN